MTAIFYQVMANETFKIYTVIFILLESEYFKALRDALTSTSKIQNRGFFLIY